MKARETIVTSNSDDYAFEERQRRRGRRTWIWFLVVALIILLLAILIYHFVSAGKAASAAANKAPQRATPVTGAKASPGNIGVYDVGLGGVTPVYTVTVHSRVDGQLMNVYYKEGQRVTKGAPLVELDPRPYQVQLTQAEGQLIKDQASLDNARVDLNRYLTLLPKNAVPEQTVATQKATVAQDEGAVKTDQGNIDSAKLNLVYCHITSPITGKVGLRLVDPGNIVHAADTNGLMVITQMEPITVIFTISEDQLPAVLQKFHAGKKLQVDAYDRENKTKISTGYLMTIDNQIDPTTGTVKLRALFDNKDDSLYPNQFVNAHLLVEEKQNVLLVPNVAIQRNGNATFVYLVKPDQTVTMRAVKVGTTQGLEAEIDSGLQAGDIVVTSGVDKLQEGSKVVVHLGENAGTAPAGSGSQGVTPAANGQPQSGSNPNPGGHGKGAGKQQ